MRQLPRFRPDGSFVIAQFTDTHFTDLGENDRKTQALIARILDREKPDLVALTGDIIAGGPGRDPVAGYAAALKPIEERKLPWCSVFGNHDDEGSMSRKELMAWQRTRPDCLNQEGPDALPGAGNFVLPLAGLGKAEAARLYFLDSGSYVRKEKPTEYAFISPSQIDWFRRLDRAVDPAPALAFFHIPFPEYDAVWDRGGCLGDKFEAVCCPKVNSGFFAALRECGDVMGTFVGHDHVNDYEGTLDGIRLCYGRASGYGGYGREKFPRGARLIRMREGKRAFETWLSLDS